MIIKKADIETIAVKPQQYPEGNLKEIAFAGRSNVGKSSLLNLLGKTAQSCSRQRKSGKDKNHKILSDK